MSARRRAATRPEHDQPPVHLDHRADVVAVAVAEVVEDLVVDRVELLAELLDLLVGEAARAGSRSGRSAMGSSRSRGRGHSSISTGPSGALTQVRTISPSRAGDLAGAQVADLARSRACRRRCGRCPCGSRRAASAPASSPATRIGLPPSHSRLDVGLQEADRAALAALAVAADRSAGSAPCAGGRSRRARSQCSSKRVEHLGRAGEEGLALAPVRAQLVEVAGRRCGRARRCAARAGGSRRCASSSSRSCSPKMTSSGVRAEWRWTTSSQRVRGGRGRAACS